MKNHPFFTFFEALQMIFAQESNFGVDAAKNRQFFFGVDFAPNVRNHWRRHTRAILRNFGCKIFKIEALTAVQKSEIFEKLHAGNSANFQQKCTKIDFEVEKLFATSI